jgi:hypothetical protein
VRADQLRFSAYDVYVLRSILRDWREFNITAACTIPPHALDDLEARLDRVDVDPQEAVSRDVPVSAAAPDDCDDAALGLGAPGDISRPLHKPHTPIPHYNY